MSSLFLRTAFVVFFIFKAVGQKRVRVAAHQVLAPVVDVLDAGPTLTNDVDLKQI